MKDKGSGEVKSSEVGKEFRMYCEYGRCFTRTLTLIPGAGNSGVMPEHQHKCSHQHAQRARRPEPIAGLIGNDGVFLI